mmetsp:Transcript_21891/g.30603  ORF Transcript_21891/g.30603 Transcript_21891/m.30603 type:complete len:241 (+) Transcript_21891:61-783(+)
MKNLELIFGLIVLINANLVISQNTIYSVSEVYYYDNCTFVTGYNVYVSNACFYNSAQNVQTYSYWTCNSTAATIRLCDDPVCTQNCQVYQQLSFDTCVSTTDSYVGDYEKLIGCWTDEKPNAYPADVYLEYQFFDNGDCNGEPVSYSFENGTCYYDPLLHEYMKQECGPNGLPITYDCQSSSDCSNCTKSKNPYQSGCYGLSDYLGFYIRCGPVPDSAVSIEISKLLIFMAVFISLFNRY